MTSSTAGTRRGPKPALTREAVIEAALDLVDEDGLAALNLRKLATRLGISAMTPYNYFADKADLLSAMVGHALAPLADDLGTGQSWDVQIDHAMHALHHTLERHPGVVDLIIAESDTARLDDFRQGLIAVLQEVGLSRARSADVLRSMTSYIVGYTLLNRMRTSSVRHRNSFDSGLEMMMSSLRDEIADFRRG